MAFWQLRPNRRLWCFCFYVYMAIKVGLLGGQLIFFGRE